jgi:phosphatidylethanolamine/phosphatidyl-N-methylethanolamine N-methyltransferase
LLRPATGYALAAKGSAPRNDGQRPYPLHPAIIRKVHKNHNLMSEQKVTLADVKTSYRRWAGVYDKVFGAVLQDGRNKLLQQVAKLQPKSILEIGVGTGLLLPHYPPQAKVVGVDVSEEMLVLAREKIAKHNLTNTSVELSDGEKLPFNDGQFECVVLPYVISVTPDPSALINEAMRLCSKSGHVIIVNHFSGSKTWAFLEKVAEPIAAKIGFHSSFSYDEHIGQSALNVIAVEPANLLGLSKVVTAKVS